MTLHLFHRLLNGKDDRAWSAPCPNEGALTSTRVNRAKFRASAA